MSVKSSEALLAARISGNYNDCQPLFIDNLTVLLVGYGSVVQAVSTDTGELVGKFSGHSQLVSSLSCPNDDELTKDVSAIAVSSSIDGVIYVWRVGDFSVVSRLDTGMVLYKVVVPQLVVSGKFITGKPSAGNSHEELYLVVGKTPKNTQVGRPSNTPVGNDDKVGNDRFKLLLYDTAACKVRRKVSTLRNARQSICTLVIGREEHVVAASKRSILVYSTLTRKSSKIANSTGNITCVVSCQSSGVVVTGHEKGEISVWHNVPQWVRAAATLGGDADAAALEPPVFTIFHWHAHPVQALGMSSDGQYIYSGGEEAVLVVWQQATGVKSFVPRLGGVITHIGTSKQSAKLAAATMDNCIHVVDSARQREEWSLRGLFMAASKSASKSVVGSTGGTAENFLQSDPSFHCAIKVDPVNSLIMCNGYPGVLQALEIGHRGLRGSHEVAQFTRVSRTEATTRIYVPSVTHFEYSSSGSNYYLTTVDVRRGEDKDRVTALKFWKFDAARSEYKLSAQVEQPHGRDHVNALALHVSTRGEAICVTGASDGSVKFWKAQQMPNPAEIRLASAGAEAAGLRKGNSISWTCAFSFKHKDSPVSACVFSRDGSTIAISQDNVISLWDPSDVSLRATLLAPGSDAITFLDFLEPRASAAMGGGAGKAYLVAGSSSALHLFDLLSLQLSWCAMGDFKGATFAVTSNESMTFSSSNNGSINYGYIAASVQCAQNQARAEHIPSKAATPKKGKAASKETAASDEEDPENDSAYQANLVLSNNICLFSVGSPVPIISQRISAGASSLYFTSRTLPDEAKSPALLCVTEANELLLFSPTSAAVPEAKVGDILADIPSNSLPGLPSTVLSNKTTAVGASPDFISFGPRSRANETLGSLLGEKSDSLPALSSISTSFLGLLLRADTAGKKEFASKDQSLSSRSTESQRDGDIFSLPGVDTNIEEALVDANNSSDGKNYSNAEEDSRVFGKHSRSRSLSFELRGDVAMTPAASDAAFLHGRVELLDTSLLGVFTGSSKVLGQSASRTNHKDVTERGFAESAHKGSSPHPKQSTRNDKTQSSADVSSLSVRASQPNSAGSSAEAAKASRPRAASDLSDASNAPRTSSRKRTGSVLSEVSESSNASSARRSTRRVA